jgi:hypothetical protein
MGRFHLKDSESIIGVIVVMERSDCSKRMTSPEAWVRRPLRGRDLLERGSILVVFVVFGHRRGTIL